MKIENAGFDAFGQITATVDGVVTTIPASPGNRHYAELLRQGIAPLDYVPPVPTSSEKIAAALENSETAGQVARGLEDVIDHLANGTPLPARAVDWALDRASKRAGAAG